MRSVVLTAGLFSLILCSAQVSMNVDLLYQWNDTTIPDNGNGSTFNDTWGFVQDGIEYGVIGSTHGTHIFRITDTDSLIEVARVPGAFQGAVVHRDFKTYMGHLYGVCQQGMSTLQIVDLSLLPDTAELVYNSNALVTQAHNVYVDTATARLYVCGPSGHALSVYDIAVPNDPQLLAHFDLVTYVHDAFVRNDTAYLNCGDQGLFVYDFSDPTAPVLLGSLTTYTDLGYNHSGWLSVDGGTYVFADESEGRRMKVCDVSDLSDIQVLGLFNSGEAETIPHNLMLKDGLVYVSHYNDGLRIFDVSEPTVPVQVGYYDTWDHPFDGSHYRGAWGVYAFLPSGRILIADRQSGLYLFRFNMPDGLGEADAHGGLRIFPNPNSGVFNVVVERPTPDAVLSVADAQGRSMWRSQPHDAAAPATLHVDLSGLAPGIYSLHMQGARTAGSVRFVVE